MERFWAKVDKSDDGCWRWLAYTNPAGYGKFQVDHVDWLAHRLSFTLTHGEIPSGLDLDHLCRNRRCVNPSHLEPVSRRENIRRGLKGELSTGCVNGHEYTPENTYQYRGYRRCRACNLANVRAYVMKRKLKERA